MAGSGSSLTASAYQYKRLDQENPAKNMYIAKLIKQYRFS